MMIVEQNTIFTRNITRRTFCAKLVLKIYEIDTLSLLDQK